MKVFLNSCHICHKEQSEATLVSEIFAEANNSGIYVHTCPMGHTVVHDVKARKFDILFGGGLSAICDGYYREAVANFAACTERFHEFYCEAIAIKNNVSLEAFKAVWDSQIRFSERQAGAFYIFYLLENGKPAPKLDSLKLSNQVGDYKYFRNQVVHNGSIPTRDEALLFGKFTFEYVTSIMNELEKITINKSDFSGMSLLEYMHRHKWHEQNLIADKKRQELDLPIENTIAYLGGIAGMLSLFVANKETVRDFEYCLKNVEQVHGQRGV